MGRCLAGEWVLGVALLSERPEHLYLFEILEHAGIPYASAGPADSPEALSGCRIWLVLSSLRAGLPEEWRKALEKHYQQGGGLVFVGSPLGMESLLKVSIAQGSNAPYTAWLGEVRSLGEGYYRPAPGAEPVHFFGGWAIKAESSPTVDELLDTQMQPMDCAPMVRPDDRITGVFVDIPWTVRRIIQGIPVQGDGVPATDGSAPLDDNILKAEDGLVLDWHADRADPCGAGFPFFHRPLADMWCELLLSEIFRVAQQCQAPLRMLWYCPRGLRSVGQISFDTDMNDPDLGHRLLDELQEIGLKSTWLVIAPGYTQDSGVVERAIEQGVEIGFHFDGGVLPESRVGEWSPENFERQKQAVATACSVDAFYTNKNHYTRWQGDVDVLRWCEAGGIAVDLTRLPSKPGTLGFFTGTCHPHLYHDIAGNPIRCLEIAGFSQDPIVTVPPETGIYLLHKVVEHCGVAEFTFHPAHIAKPGVADALKALIAEGQRLGIQWWTAREVGEWENARRQAAWNRVGLPEFAGEPPGVPEVLELSQEGDFRYAGHSFKRVST